MQIFALDETGMRHFAQNAKRHKSYFCLECNGAVRLRGGRYRQLHFYHLRPSHSCRQSGKSPTHLAIQKKLSSLLPPSESQLEYPMLSIGRIADIAWPAQKIVFEIQCSPLSVEEAKERMDDYSSEGYQVIWILHERIFNRHRLSSLENFLAPFPHYFTNCDASGNGLLYDQLFSLQGRQKRFLSPKIPIQPQLPHALTHPLKDPRLERRNKWPLFFQGDWVDRALSHSLPPLSKPIRTRHNFIAVFYRALLHSLLDKTSL